MGGGRELGSDLDLDPRGKYFGSGKLILWIPNTDLRVVKIIFKTHIDVLLKFYQ